MRGAEYAGRPASTPALRGRNIVFPGATLEAYVARGEESTYRFGDDEAPSSADGGNGLAIETAHGAQPVRLRVGAGDTHAG